MNERISEVNQPSPYFTLNSNRGTPMNHLSKQMRLLKLALAMLMAACLTGLAFLAVPMASGATKGVVATLDEISRPGLKDDLRPSFPLASEPVMIKDESAARLPLAQQTTYTVPFVIDNTANTSVLTDYQVLVTLDTAIQISQGHMLSDCGDIRFYDSSQVISLTYWLESGCNTSSTRVWVKIPSIPATSTEKIYLTYGDSSSSESNGDAVFEFFDDFTGSNGSVLNSSKWITDAVK